MREVASILPSLLSLLRPPFCLYSSLLRFTTLRFLPVTTLPFLLSLLYPSLCHFSSFVPVLPSVISLHSFLSLLCLPSGRCSTLYGCTVLYCPSGRCSTLYGQKVLPTVAELWRFIFSHLLGPWVIGRLLRRSQAFAYDVIKLAEEARELFVREPRCLQLRVRQAMYCSVL